MECSYCCDDLAGGINTDAGSRLAHIRTGYLSRFTTVGRRSSDYSFCLEFCWRSEKGVIESVKTRGEDKCE